MVLSLLVFLLGCNSRPDARSHFKFYREIPKIDKKSVRHSVTKRQPTQKQLKYLAAAKEARDVFPMDHCIPLEATDGSLLSTVNRVLYIDGHWVILDIQGNKVLKFDEEGRFEHPLGQVGQGPGEYLKVMDIHAVFDNNIAFLDWMSGRLIVYDLNGQVVRQTPMPGSGEGDGSRFIIRDALLWNTADRMILADFQADSPELPMHVVLDTSQPGGKVLFGFGKRWPVYQRWMNENSASHHYFRCFKEIEGRIWAANPLWADIQIFEADGAHYKTARGGHPYNMQEEDYLEAGPERERLRGVRLKKLTNYMLFQFENVVVQHLIGGRNQIYNIYDLDGNLLRASVKVDAPSFMTRGASETYVVSIADELPATVYNEQEKNLLQQVGWNESLAENSNPILCLRRPVWDN